MGSFAYTCCISGLPIEAGDKVRFMMLTRNPYYEEGRHNCYIDGLWFPRALPLRASYNDYGSIEGAQDPFIQQSWLDGLRMDLVELAIGKNKYHDVATSKDMSFDELLEALWEGRVLVKSNVDTNGFLWDKKLEQNKGVNISVAQAMIREDVWSALVNLNVSMAKRYRAAAREWYTKKVLNSDKDEIRYAFMRVQAPLGLFSFEYILSDTKPCTVGLGTHLYMLAKKCTFSDEIIDLLGEFACITAILSRMCRYQWSPSGGSGPQEGDWKSHVAFLGSMLGVAKENLARSNARGQE